MGWIKRLIYSLFCSPFQVGNPNDNNRNRFGHIIQDGLFSAIQVFIMLLSATVAISFAGRFQSAEPLDIQFITLSKAFFLNLTLFIMVVWMIQGCYWYQKKKRNQRAQGGRYRQVQPRQPLDAKRLKRWAKLSIPLLGMLMFMAGAIVIDIQAIIAYGTCLSDPELLGPQIEIWHHSMKILFFMAVFVLCSVISTDSQQDRNFFLKRYGLCLILVMVIWLAIDCQLNESKDLFKGATIKCEATPITVNGTTISKDELIHHSCECEVLGVFNRYHQVSQYMYPFITEFCLLASECILHRLFHSRRQEPQSEDPGEPLSCTESLPLLQSIAFLVSLIVGVVYIVLPSYWGVTQTFGEGVIYTASYYKYKIGYRSLAILVTKIGFFSASYMDIADSGYTGYEMLVMFSSFGQYLHNTFDLAAVASELYTADHCTENCSPELSTTLGTTGSSLFTPSLFTNRLHMASMVLAYYQIYTQTTFMLHALKLKPVEGKELACKVVKACLTFLAVTNLLLWVLESFIELKGLGKVYQTEVAFYSFETWTTLSEIIFPIMVFYRFNSAIVMTGTILTY